ncbi:MAG: ATP-binding cassette domain-containing protein [Eubacteriales bacterium]|nr:ATP-binding cassette domain-containing protein [Eubacteriales bacterium]
MSDIVFEHVNKQQDGLSPLYDISFSVKQGEVYTILASKNSGKHTILSLLMGLVKPDSGSVTLKGKDCFLQRRQVHKMAGFVSYRAPFPYSADGEKYIRFLADWHGNASFKKMQYIMEKLNINPLGSFKHMDDDNIRKMSVLAGLMYDSPILVLDEPYAGLNPVDRDSLTQILAEEKEQGKTILLMTRILQQAQKISDKICIMRKGRIVVEQHAEALNAIRQKVYHISFSTEDEASRFSQEWENGVELLGKRAIVAVPGSPKALIKTLADYDVMDFVGGKEDGEEFFLRFYGDEMQ